MPTPETLWDLLQYMSFVAFICSGIACYQIGYRSGMQDKEKKAKTATIAQVHEMYKKEA